MKKKRFFGNTEAVRIIEKNYNRLKECCISGKNGFFRGVSYEDIFQETILDVFFNENYKEKNGFSEIKDLFMYRFNVFLYRAVKDSRKIKTEEYADNKKGEEKIGF